MPDLSPYSQYKAASVQTLTPGELVVLMYEEAAASVNRAVFFINGKKLSSAHESIMRAEKIVLYLAEILDFRYPISSELSSLYEYIHSLLVDANIRKDAKALSEAARVLTELKETWRQADASGRQNRVSTEVI